MVGSPAVAGVIALWGFWILLAAGWVRGDLHAKGTILFVFLWLAGIFSLRSMVYGLLVAPYVAVLDIALVFVVFKGDVRLT